MKSKKPFLIVCAAALTLALALPFMGVFAFADDSLVDIPVEGSSYSFILNYRLLGASSWDSKEFSSSGFVSLPRGVVIELRAQLYVSGQGYRDCELRLDSYRGSFLSTDSNNPTLFSDPYPLIFRSSYDTSGNSRLFYIFIESPPDPLAPVSDGIDTMISVFGDVIDYIINTPDVAIFVAISVASCAIIPMGIILIKKLIKGY